jgi:hypothetical protein
MQEYLFKIHANMIESRSKTAVKHAAFYSVLGTLYVLFTTSFPYLKGLRMLLFDLRSIFYPLWLFGVF